MLYIEITYGHLIKPNVDKNKIQNSCLMNIFYPTFSCTPFLHKVLVNSLVNDVPMVHIQGYNGPCKEVGVI